MREKLWKYKEEKPRLKFDEYFKMEDNETVIIKVKYPEIIKKLIEGDNRTVFHGTVIEINGQPTEKIIILKNYDNVMFLKSKKGKHKEMKLELTKKYNEDEMETYYDIKVLK
jgi:hypothetical protein